MNTVATQERKEIARPLNVLVPLIREDLRHGDEAAERASMPYYEAAGEKLLEAKSQLARGEWQSWLRRNFDKSQDQANRYMALATSNIQNPRARDFSSLRAFDRHSGRDTRPTGGAVRRDWTAPVDNIADRARREMERIKEQELNRVQERAADQKLAMQLIEIGFKVLAKELHPDKGGSRDAMARLNRVRNRLKDCASKI